VKSKSLASEDNSTFVLVFDPGDEIVKTLLDFSRQEKITAARISAVGAISRAVIGYFDREKKEYKRNPVNEQVEVASLTGTIAVQDGETKLHAHCVLGRRDGSALAGHLLQAHVWPTLELVLVTYPDTLRRQKDPDTGLALLVP
jgi:predicted DNA-binding protein with PD1-like motif